MLHVLILMATCNVADAQAKAAHAKELMVQVEQDQQAIATLDAQLAALKVALETEKKNPSGVVDLRKLHEIGEDIQYTEAQKREAVTVDKKDESQLRLAIAEATKAVQACQKK